MADISWFEMAEQFEAVDPWGLLELHWIYRKDNHKYIYTVGFSSASSFVEASEPERTKPTVMQEKFTALCARASRKMGLVSGTADSWLAQVSIGHRITSFEGIADHPALNKPVEVKTGRISNIAQKSAALCYKIDSSPDTHGGPPVPPPAHTQRKRQPGTITSPIAAQRAADYMQDKGFTQAAFGKLAGGISDRTVRSFLKTGTIRKGLLGGVAKALKIDVDALLAPLETGGNKAESKRKN